MNIKRLSLLGILLLPLLCRAQSTMVFDQGLRFCEGSVPYKNMVLVSNFGSSELNPLNTEGKGYIASIQGDRVGILIPAAGFLNAPKGMAIYANHLFVADVGRVVVFSLKKPTQKPRYIELGKDDLFANDVAVLGELILVSVTNTGCIYAIDATDIEHLGQANKIGKVEGANGMVVSGTKLYVASYDPSEKPTSVNVIYVYDLSTPSVPFKPLIKDLVPGQYDGITLSRDGERLYFSSWTGLNGPTIYSYALSGAEPVRTLDFGVKFIGPADISVVGGEIYIPDLPASKVYRFTL